MNKHYQFFIYGFLLFICVLPLENYLLSLAFMGFLIMAIGISHFEMYMNHGRRLQSLAYANAAYNFALLFAYPMFQNHVSFIFQLIYSIVFVVFTLSKVHLFYELMKFFEDICLVPDMTLSQNFNALKLTFPAALLMSDLLLISKYWVNADWLDYGHIFFSVFAFFVELRVLFNIHKLTKM